MNRTFTNAQNQGFNNLSIARTSTAYYHRWDGRLWFPSFGLHVVCFGCPLPWVWPFSSTTQRAIHVFWLVWHWVSSIARTPTVTCRRLGPFSPSYSASSVDFGAVRVLMNGLTCHTAAFVFSLTNLYRNLNWYILQTKKRNKVKGFN